MDAQGSKTMHDRPTGQVITTAAACLRDIVPKRFRWWLGIPSAILIGVGAYLFVAYWGRADAEYLFTVIFSKNPDFIWKGIPAFVAKALTDALRFDCLVIPGYCLALIVCALVFKYLAFSESGKKLSRYILAAAVVATVAHILEDVLIYCVLHRTPGGLLARVPSAIWIYAPPAMATVKWCALVVAVTAAPAAFFSVIRVGLSHWRMSRYRRRHTGQNWWDDALPEPGPEPEEGDVEAAWRRAYYVPDGNGAGGRRDDGSAPTPTALCLSGGGIRSACVAMGAMQQLAFPRGAVADAWPPGPALDDFDYVISVSGGGFSAGARVLSVQPEPTRGRRVGGAIARLSERFSPGSVEFDYLRRRCDYLADSPLALLRALAEVFKNLLASLLILASSAVIMGWLLGMFVNYFPFRAVVPYRGDLPPSSPVGHPRVEIEALHARPAAALAAIAVPVAAVIACIVLGLICEWASASPVSTKCQNFFGQWGRRAALLAMLVFGLSVAGPALMWLCLQRPDKGPVGAIGGIAAVVTLQFSTTLLSMTSKKDSPVNPSRWLKLVPSGVVRLALVVLTLGVLLVAWLLLLGTVAGYVFNLEIQHAIANPTRSRQPLTSDVQCLYLGLIALIALLLSSFDVTSLSLHPFYRQRLAHAFAVRRLRGKAVEYEACESTWLDQYGKTQTGGPKFVFAAAAAISDGDIRPAPGLNAVSFVMTADYVGGPALGWLKTEELRHASPPRIQRDLTVQAAIAVSGAAFASAMGRQGQGIQSLLALSGARLGTWLPNPLFVRNIQLNAADPSFPKALPSVRGAGYFYRELLGINKFDARLVQVTDGGHYENLGLVEALRRRCRLIYCIDSSGDCPPLLSGLSDAIRLARFELGVEITMENGGPFGVENLAPGSGDQFGDTNAFCSLNARVTKCAVARGRITYPEAAGIETEDARTGWLIVAKAVLWQELPDWVLTYAAEHGGAEFPHDNTSDQWFSEGQFAAYTEVGRSIALCAMKVPGDGTVPPIKPTVQTVNGSQPAEPRMPAA
ncbi:patatin-like phospholipase family protein [Mycobacterium interjectum]|uniref:patatin-like phospholipase family protein n=1 Tax=Mycobacterium interjectum TaxID=33895 RepID=UPI000A70EE5C|nr:patatin-like phospholipase family protein [Mycobacterium interjectum]MCV7092027.1 patatin-like phospholipase family protein [Mycobacterium interjectum]